MPLQPRRSTATLRFLLGLSIAGLLGQSDARGQFAALADHAGGESLDPAEAAPELFSPNFILASACEQAPPAALGGCDGALGGCDGGLSGHAGCESFWTREKLTGDWLGCRSGLASSGFTFDVSTTQYYQGVTSGGREQTFEYGGRNDYFLNVDGQKAGLWQGSFITLHGETRYADSVNPLTGTLLPPNLALAVPLPRDVTALTGVKFTQFLAEDKLVFAGKLNVFDDFRQPLTGAGLTNGFMNTSLMINPVVVRTVPYSTFGAGFVKLHNMEPLFSLLVLDTNYTPTTTGFDSFFDNGVTLVSSLNLPTTFGGLPGHQGITGTYSTGTYTNLSPSAYFEPGQGVVVETAPKEGSWSLGYNFDQAFYVSPDDPRKRWGIFGNLGIADDNPSPIHWIANVGLAGTSPLRNRQADTFGAGYFYTGVSEPLKDLAPILLPLGDEQGFEMYYNVAVTPWCHVTPDLQVLEPFRQRVDSSLLFGVRAKVDF
jgi:porin